MCLYKESKKRYQQSEKGKATHAKWLAREDVKEKIRERQNDAKKWRTKNDPKYREKLRVYAAQYRRRNKEKLKEYADAYREKRRQEELDLQQELHAKASSSERVQRTLDKCPAASFLYGAR